MSKAHPHNRRFKEGPGVAPADILREDFRALDLRETLRTTYEIEQLILMQTVEGHAHEGHGLFYGSRFPNTTMDDISKALKMSPAEVKMDRQRLIDDVREFVRRVISGERPRFAVNADDEPLIGIGTLRALELDAKGVLQGLYLGGLRDQFDIRSEAQDKFGVTIGFGKGYYVDRRVMHDMGLNGQMLSQEGHADDIERFKHLGLIVDSPDGSDVQYMYIRHQSGPGASDDAAIVAAGLLFGISAAVGCFLADAMDTLEKYVPEAGDQDAAIGRMVEESSYDVGITHDDVVDLTYLAAAPEGRRDVPDSSLRHMLSVDRKIDQCVLESHFFYVQKKPFSVQKMDHGQCTNLEFYDYVEEKLAGYRAGK